MASLLDIPEAETALDPRIWVEPKDARPEKEVVRQSSIVLHLRKHARRLMVWSTPNAAQKESAKMWQAREGAWYGAADLNVAWAGGCAFMEVKAGKTMPRPNQIDFLNALARRDHHVAVVRSPEGAMAFLASIGAPVAAPVSSLDARPIGEIVKPIVARAAKQVRG